MASRLLGHSSTQSTLLCQGQLGGFTPVTGDSVAILHDEAHWVASGSRDGSVLFADSGSNPISAIVATQMRQLYGAMAKRSGHLEVQYIPSDRQPNQSDCGVYAVAIAFEWAVGMTSGGQSGFKDLEVGFDTPKMRAHLVECLEHDEVAVFPKVRVRRRGRKRGVKKCVL